MRAYELSKRRALRAAGVLRERQSSRFAIRLSGRTVRRDGETLYVAEWFFDIFWRRFLRVALERFRNEIL